ncbi:hypothetical protein [Sphingomicrobium astaxanthinifaciens]|uniref:hypothetical protein n=1 Tax=Sphingomicrobium astaxanthinifaciens TaxID=1227949 RepID=UPI001FCCAEA1|nr:hypothetical protein [Sphingomicrobium astaxanthinifaciens]MCJ7421261.1 hypothetical protein [Sphingomicrobium astaxanthinifaciens]
MMIAPARRWRLGMVPAAGIGLGLLLAGCSLGDDRDRSLMRCERTLAQNAPSPAVARQACTCIVDGLEAEGLSILAAARSERGQAIVRRCGRAAGLPMTPR